MREDKPSQVLSIRIDPALLQAVRERAREEGRSVSGEIVFLVRAQLDPGRSSREPSRPITGWLADREVLSTHAEFREARADASAAVRRSVRRKTRVTPRKRRA